MGGGEVLEVAWEERRGWDWGVGGCFVGWRGSPCSLGGDTHGSAGKCSSGTCNKCIKCVNQTYHMTLSDTPP